MHSCSGVPVALCRRTLAAGLDPAELRAIAREVVALLSDDVIRDIAASIVPEVADRVVRERIRELEAED